MSDHSTALVPLESWPFSSFELRKEGKTIDLGLLAESLIYYDRVLINVTNPEQFAEVLRWFIKHNSLDLFYSLISDGTITIYDWSFYTGSVQAPDGTFDIINIQDELQAKPGTFEQRYLYSKPVEDLFPSPGKRTYLYKVLRDHVIEVKASEYVGGHASAKAELTDPEANARLVQTLVNETYPKLGLGDPPVIRAEITKKGSERVTIKYNVDLSPLYTALGKANNCGTHTIVTAAGHTNRLLWSAAQRKCDLFLGRPIGTLVGNKLAQAGSFAKDRAAKTIEQLVRKVEYPDIRSLINSSQLAIDDVFKFRRHGKKFRHWLQQEHSRDWDAIAAYHNEVAKEVAFVKEARSFLRIFGYVAVPTVGFIAGTQTGTITGQAIGTALGGAATFLLELASKINENWRPVVFGEWLKDKVHER